eukprot:NODE_965_length_2851_cov_0.895712.p1 type:complete len:731 gc:universal NODE_965_length_2851_cov_0.895712:286-2478(+)
MENFINNSQSELRNLRTHIISGKSATNYMGALSNFIFWVYSNCPSIVFSELKDILNEHKTVYDQSIAQLISTQQDPIAREVELTRLNTTYLREQKKRIKRWFSDSSETDNRNPPIEIEAVTGDIVSTFLLQLRKRNGEPPGYSTYNTNRAAIRHLFRLYRFQVPAEFDHILTLDFKSLKRVVAIRVNDGGEAVQVGKSPMEFTLYKYIANNFFTGSRREDVFANCFLTLCWNLMARVGNIEAVCLQHIEWEDDAMMIFFAQGKTDQVGENAKYPRHIYANPTYPEICPILNLAILLLCFPLQDNQVKLFHGSAQYERFRKLLDKNLKTKCLLELTSRGLEASQIGTHSVRKGASSYAASGTTASPSALAIHLRAGWSFAGVQDRYIHVEAAGDQYVGRTVCGLPILDSKFATSPPFFKTTPNDLNEIISQNFINLPSSLYRVAEYCLASLVYHRNYLFRVFEPTHPLFNSAIFRSTTQMNNLADLVVIDVGNMTTSERIINLTGIPPHISLLVKLDKVAQNIDVIIEKVNSSVEETAHRIVQYIDERSLVSGIATVQQMESIISNSVNYTLSESGILNLLSTQNRSDTNINEVPNQNQNRRYQMHTIGDRLSMVPLDFKFPRCSIAVAYQLWCCGDERNGYPPFRMLSSKDMANRTMTARLSEFQFIMRLVDRLTGFREFRSRDLQLTQVIEKFDQQSVNIPIPQRTPSGRIRRIGQLNWRTCYNILKNT